MKSAKHCGFDPPQLFDDIATKQSRIGSLTGIMHDEEGAAKKCRLVPNC